MVTSSGPRDEMCLFLIGGDEKKVEIIRRDSNDPRHVGVFRYLEGHQSDGKWFEMGKKCAPAGRARVPNLV